MTACFLRAEASLLGKLITLTSRVVAGVAKAHCQQAVSRASLAHVHSNCTKRAVWRSVEDQLSSSLLQTRVELVRATTTLADAYRSCVCVHTVTVC